MKNILICLLISGCMFSIQTPLQAQNSQKLFQQGIIQEEGEGNLTKAIEIYNSLVNNVSVKRALRAKALLHVGICYEKLGNQNARKTYQKLISEYSDQEAIVAMGLQQLKGLKKPNLIAQKTGIVASQVWSPAKDTYGVSPDGRYLNYIDWNNISLNLKDLYNGSTRVISPVGTWKTPSQFPDNSIWSPDGKKLAYYWFVGDDTELHIVNVDGSSDRILAKGHRDTGPWPITWSPDGKYILASTKNEFGSEKSRKVIRVSVKDGSEKELKTLVNCGCYMDISPDGKYIVYAYPQSENSEQKDIHILSMDGSIDKKIVTDLANDDSPVWSRDGNEILFVSNRYGTNDLWRLNIEYGNPIGAAEIVKVDLGSRYRLFHSTKDNAVFYGSINTRFDIYTANINDDRNEAFKISTLDAKMNINPSWSQDGRYAAYFRYSRFRYPDLGNKYLLSIYDTKTKTRREVDTGVYGDSNVHKPQWSPDGKKLLLYGIIKKNMEGGLFLYDIETGKKIAVKTEKNMSRKKMNHYNKYYTYSNDGKIVFYLSKDQKSILKYDIRSKRESTVYSGTIEGLYFKVSNDNSTIAFGHWYDNKNELYSVSTSGGNKKKIFEADCDCSPILISWSKDDKFLYYQEGKFRNLKKIMRVAVNGGEPEEVYTFKDTFENAQIIQVDLHPDGNSMLIQVAVGKAGAIWKLEGLFNQ